MRDRAPGRFAHGLVHPGVPLAQRKEQRERSWPDHQSSDTTVCHGVLPSFLCGAAAHLGEQNEVSRVFLETQPPNVGTHRSFIREALEQHSSLSIHVFEEKKKIKLELKGALQGSHQRCL